MIMKINEERENRGKHRNHKMYHIEQNIKVKLEFPAMLEPVEVDVPWSVLRFLDFHADRYFGADGSVIYRRRPEKMTQVYTSTGGENQIYAMA